MKNELDGGRTAQHLRAPEQGGFCLCSGCSAILQLTIFAPLTLTICVHGYHPHQTERLSHFLPVFLLPWPGFTISYNSTISCYQTDVSKAHLGMSPSIVQNPS